MKYDEMILTIAELKEMADNKESPATLKDKAAGLAESLKIMINEADGSDSPEGAERTRIFSTEKNRLMHAVKVLKDNLTQLENKDFKSMVAFKINSSIALFQTMAKITIPSHVVNENDGDYDNKGSTKP
jgi:hypothetical protein